MQRLTESQIIRRLQALRKIGERDKHPDHMLVDGKRVRTVNDDGAEELDRRSLEDVFGYDPFHEDDA